MLSPLLLKRKTASSSGLDSVQSGYSNVIASSEYTRNPVSAGVVAGSHPVEKHRTSMRETRVAESFLGITIYSPLDWSGCYYNTGER